MEFLCPNCENETVLPEILEVNEKDPFNKVYECEYCNNICILDEDIYEYCNRCKCLFLKTLESCVQCGFTNIQNIFTNEDITYSSSNIEITKQNLLHPKFIYIQGENEYLDAINTLNNMDVIACDTEGNGLNVFDLELFLIQLGNEEIVYIFNFDWHEKLKLETFWKDENKLFLLHNAKFDYKILKNNLNIEILNIFDTMIAQRLLTCGIIRENSLKAVVKKYLDLSLDKEIVLDFLEITRKSFHNKVNFELLEYSARDVVVLPLLYRHQKILLQNEGLDEIAQLEFEVIKAISDIELAGIYVDIEKWKEIIKHNEQERDKIKIEIFKFINGNINSKKLDNSQSLSVSDKNKYPIKSLFSENSKEEMGLSDSTNEINLNSTQALKKVFLDFGLVVGDTSDSTLGLLKHPLADLIRNYRGFEKQLSAFGESFLKLVRSDSNRVHPSFNQIGADTGRMSCNNPNMQQIPATEEYRSCFSAPKGRKIVTCDYSQQELRLLASLSGDPKFIKMYEDGVDLHSATASLMYNIPIDQVPKDKRSAAKTINFGLAYGRGAKALAEFLGITEQEGKDMISIYFSQFSFIGDWLNGAAKFSQENGYSTTLFGRKRYYKIPSELNPEYSSIMARIGRQGKNSPIQGSGVDMVKLALIKIRNELQKEKLDAFLVNTVHDEIVIESSEKDSQRAYEIIEECMVDAGRTIVKNVPILAEAAINDFWKH